MNSGNRDQATQDPTAVLAANDSKDIAPRNLAVTRFRTKYVNKPKMDSYLDGQLGKGKYEVSMQDEMYEVQALRHLPNDAPWHFSDGVPQDTKFHMEKTWIDVYPNGRITRNGAKKWSTWSVGE